MRKCRTMTIEIFGILMRAVALVMEGLANSPITSSTSLHVLASDQSIISLIRNVFFSLFRQNGIFESFLMHTHGEDH